MQGCEFLLGGFFRLTRRHQHSPSNFCNRDSDDSESAKAMSPVRKPVCARNENFLIS